MNDNKNHFDFKDLMAVGMFIFITTGIHLHDLSLMISGIEKPPSE